MTKFISKAIQISQQPKQYLRKKRLNLELCTNCLTVSQTADVIGKSFKRTQNTGDRVRKQKATVFISPGQDLETQSPKSKNIEGTKLDIAVDNQDSEGGEEVNSTQDTTNYQSKLESNSKDNFYTQTQTRWTKRTLRKQSTNNRLYKTVRRTQTKRLKIQVCII